MSSLSRSDLAVSVRGLGKAYEIAHDEPQHSTLAEAALQRLRRPLHRAPRETFWALKDVSFDIARGEVVGIIGRNGAGKSTLLKILSRITEPAAGEADLYGRVGSLLEVGTGFHPELTGRENIFLNGAILGMSRSEVRKQFDAIVDFAGVPRFLDTPVKRYSSGMYVRLAFAVAAHFNPEILIVDEVLAVGDAQFQKKCLGKMHDVAREQQRTVLFVSHNMSAVESLCTQTIYLAGGRVRQIGPTAEVVRTYLDDSARTSALCPLHQRTDRLGSGALRVTGFHICDLAGKVQKTLRSGGDYTLVLDYEWNGPGMGPVGEVVGSIAITDQRGTVLLLRSSFTNQNMTVKAPRGRIECTIRDLNLAAGTYNATLFLSHGEAEVFDLIENAAEFPVEGGDYFGTGSPGLPSLCKVLARAAWRVA